MIKYSMKLNHLNLIVTDVIATSAFLEKYFGFTTLGRGNANMAFLSDGHGMVLIMFKGTDVTYPEGFHIGFLQESENEVNEIHTRLKADGIAVPNPQRLQGGRWSFYFQAPGGFTIEVEHVTFGG
jgi:lactoylglutathione lyase